MTAKRSTLALASIGVATLIVAATGRAEEAEPGNAALPSEGSTEAGSRPHAPAQAGQQDALRHGIAACAATEGDLARLACYDKLSVENGLAGSQPLPNGIVGNAGKWSVNVSTNPVDDTTSVVLQLTADSGVGRFGQPIELFGLCKSKETAAYVSWGTYLGYDGYIENPYKTVLVRIDKDKAEKQSWNVSTNNTGTFSREPVKLLRQMAKAGTLLLQTTPYGENPITAVFDIRGLGKALEPLMKECGWALAEEKPAPPPNTTVS